MSPKLVASSQRAVRVSVFKRRVRWLGAVVQALILTENAAGSNCRRSSRMNARRRGPLEASPADEHRAPLLQESLHALFLVVRIEEHLKHLAFQQQCSCQRNIGARLDDIEN